MRRVLDLIETNGPLTIRDIDDEVLVDKVHPWASRKPSKRALQLAFYTGRVTISARTGMLKTYELMDRHFGWGRAAEARTRTRTHCLSARSRLAHAGRRQSRLHLPSRMRRGSRRSAA